MFRGCQIFCGDPLGGHRYLGLEAQSDLCPVQPVHEDKTVSLGVRKKIYNPGDKWRLPRELELLNCCYD